MFSIAASKVASKATENAVKLGEIASQKAVELGGTVSEKVMEHNIRPCSISIYTVGMVDG